MPHVLFVCTANICRSPVAAGILRDRLQKRGEVGWTVSSAGTWAVEEREAAGNSIRVMADEGIDIGDHRARIVTGEILESADLVLAMETGHAEAMRAEFSEAADRIFLLTEMAGKRYSISDPYGSPLEKYQLMAAEVAQLIDTGLPRIIRLAREHARYRRRKQG